MNAAPVYNLGPHMYRIVRVPQPDHPVVDVAYAVEYALFGLNGFRESRGPYGQGGNAHPWRRSHHLHNSHDAARKYARRLLRPGPTDA